MVFGRKNKEEEDLDRVTDVLGTNLESLIAILVKALPDKVAQFGVMNGVNVSGTDYMYQFVVAREDHPHFEELKKVNED